MSFILRMKYYISKKKNHTLRALRTPFVVFSHEDRFSFPIKQINEQ